MPGNVLIVDDSATTRKMVRRTLELAGLDTNEVYEASNGIEALSILYDHEVAVMMVDINMPTMNGIQLLNRMKENDRLRHIPFVIASTEGSRQRIEELKRSGAFGYVRKPFKPEQLRDVLKPLLGVKDEVESNSVGSGDDSF